MTNDIKILHTEHIKQIRDSLIDDGTDSIGQLTREGFVNGYIAESMRDSENPCGWSIPAKPSEMMALLRHTSPLIRYYSEGQQVECLTERQVRGGWSGVRTPSRLKHVTGVRWLVQHASGKDWQG